MIRQCAILFGCLALGELIVWLTGIKLPSSIIGMLLLTLFLKLGWIKLHWVQGMSDFLVANLGFFFVPPGVALMENEFFLLAITFGIFFFAKLLQKKTGIMLLNPILLTIALLILFLKMTGISYETYNQGGHLIEFWLKPAVVALGVPLYLQLETIKKQLLPILLSQLAGCIVGVVSVVLIAKWMGASDEIIYSLAPKSVTTPIAMEVTKSLGGIPSLTAAVVVCVGLLGGILGFKTMRLTHIGSPMAQGLSLGTAAHAVGTSTAMEVSRKYGAFASLGLTLNGIFTALFTPTILRLLGLL